MQDDLDAMGRATASGGASPDSNGSAVPSWPDALDAAGRFVGDQPSQPFPEAIIRQSPAIRARTVVVL